MPPEVLIQVDPTEFESLKEDLENRLGVSIIKTSTLPREISVPEYELTWEEELSRLEDLIQNCAWASDINDKIHFSNFTNLLITLPQVYENNFKLYEQNPSTFLEDVQEIFNRSLSNLKQNPVRNSHSVIVSGKQRIVYERFYEDDLTPKEIRLLINGFNLTGEAKTRLEMQAIEGVDRISQAIRNSSVNLAHRLRDLQNQKTS
ncbi:MAG TPA: hypothetical protein VIK81_03535 [Patescibacteria group bacterium]